MAERTAVLGYKICTADQWSSCTGTGVLPPSPVDARDGFVHLSSAAQLAETARRHFADHEELWLLALDIAALGDAVRWEPSRGGALFPHLYGSVQATAIQHAAALVRDDAGSLQWPPWAAQPAGGTDSARTPDAPAKP